MVLTFWVSKPRRFSFNIHKARDDRTVFPSATEPELPPVPQESGERFRHSVEEVEMHEALGEAEIARKEHVERREKDTSSRFETADGVVRSIMGISTQPVLPIVGEVQDGEDSCSTQVDRHSYSYNSESSTKDSDVSLDTGLDSSFQKQALQVGNVLAERKAAEPRRTNCKSQVQKEFIALTHFFDESQVPSAVECSRQRSYSIESMESLYGLDNDSLGESPEVAQPGPAQGLRRSTSQPLEVTAEGAQAEAKADAKWRHRSASIDCGVVLGDRGGKKEADVLQKLGLKAREVGARNKTKWMRRTMWNQCFYLSLAHAYVGDSDSDRQTKRLARRLRYAIEAAVLEKHPSWSQGLQDSVAGNGPAMVFADFLQIAMRVDSVPKESNFLSKLAVCVVDSIGGHAEVYLGPLYSGLTSRAEQEKNFIVLLHVPGHYCCLVCNDVQGSQIGMTYPEFKQMLIEKGVFYIETMA